MRHGYVSSYRFMCMVIFLKVTPSNTVAWVSMEATEKVLRMAGTWYDFIAAAT
jgi:hypothetical protein